MSTQRIRGNLQEMIDRAHEEKIKAQEETIKKEEEEKKFKDLLLVKDDIIIELEDKYHFDRMYQSIEKFNDILPSLINYIDAPNPKLKKSLLKKFDDFIECYNNL